MHDFEGYETDVIPTSAGDLEITFLGHGSLVLVFQGKNYYVDPYSKVADYSRLPEAHVLFITHEHRDHLDAEAYSHVRTNDTTVILTEACAEDIEGGIVMHNGDSRRIDRIQVDAMPAYNLVHMREPGKPYHPKGAGNGYILTFGDKRIYIAGDTENIPEMKDLRDIYCAFLPMNLPYTMTPEMVADAAKAFRPKILYPYHFGSTDTSRLVELLKDEPGVEVRIRKLS